MKKFCERCLEEYDEGEIYPSKYFKKLFCTPCEKEYEMKFNMFRIEFMNNQPERSKREDVKVKKDLSIKPLIEIDGYKSTIA